MTKAQYFDKSLFKDTKFEIGCWVHVLIPFLRAIGKYKSLLVSRLGLTCPLLVTAL